MYKQVEDNLRNLPFPKLPPLVNLLPVDWDKHVSCPYVKVDNDNEDFVTIQNWDITNNSVHVVSRRFDKHTLNQVNQDALTQIRPGVYECKQRPGVYLLPHYLDRDFLDRYADMCFDQLPFDPDSYTNLNAAEVRNSASLDAVTTEDKSSQTQPPVEKLPPTAREPRSTDGLRWISIGCSYDWTERVYFRQGVLPEDLQAKAQAGVSLAGVACKDFRPDCALINYYGKSDRLRGHLDDAEECLDLPLITFSLGRSAIFLVGGLSRDDLPVPIVLHHGDCCIMSGQARLVYHGIPKMLTYSPVVPQRRRRDKKTENEISDDDAMRLFDLNHPRLLHQRINISVRQYTRRCAV